MKFLEKFKNLALDFFAGYGLTIVKAIAFLVVGLLLIYIIKRTVKKATVKSRKVDYSATTFITGFVSLVVYVLLAVSLVSVLGFSTTGIIAALSSVLLAIALGMQNTLSSLTNGILLIFTKPFATGDYVDIGGTGGTVKDIRLFSVKIVTPDNLTVIIPNSTVLNSVITNYSRMPLRRMDIVVPISYMEDVAEVKRVVGEVIKADKRIETNPEPFFRLTEYGASCLNFTLRAWTDIGEYWNVRFDLLENILAALRKNKIEIPYNQLDVHVIEPHKTLTETEIEMDAEVKHE